MGLDSCRVAVAAQGATQTCPREIQTVLNCILRVIVKALIHGVIFGGPAKEHSLYVSVDVCVSLYMHTCLTACFLYY